MGLGKSADGTLVNELTMPRPASKFARTAITPQADLRAKIHELHARPRQEGVFLTGARLRASVMPALRRSAGRRSRVARGFCVSRSGQCVPYTNRSDPTVRSRW